MTLRRPWLVGLVVLATAVYVTLWVGWSMQWNWLADVDARGLGAFYRFGVEHPAWVTFWRVLCTVLGPNAFRIVGLVVIVVALRHRQLRLALFLVLSVELSGLVTEALKSAAHRPRPETALVYAPSWSFPSGHALGVSAAVMALAVIVLPRVRRDRWRWVITGGTLTVLVIGIGRVVLNVHNPSDVLAGWAAGYVWFAASLLVLTRGHVRSADETPVEHGSAP
jgi:undecaprenyl-diphosphatase